MEHGNQERIERDHITLWVGNGHYISIVKEESSYHSGKEIALVEFRAASSLLGFDSRRCVPLCEWFDDSLDDGELTIDIEYEVNEAEIVSLAISKAFAYINRDQETK